VPAWFWLNVPLCIAIAAAVTGVLIWFVFKHPDERSAVHPAHARCLTARERAVLVRCRVLWWSRGFQPIPPSRN
jgi:hypothetical protein